GVKEPMVFTTRPCRRVELEFGLQLEPIELNILADVQGGGIRLARTADVLPGQDHRLDLFRYYNRYPRWVFEHLVPSFREQLGQRLAGLTGIGPVDRAIARTYARLRPRDRS
ncbi:MAG TPA: hypothetical protein PLA11_16875, partial [Flavobacteriales bacterium]|nr:hypothetical protein [Flavobacteriales bacterium]